MKITQFVIVLDLLAVRLRLCVQANRINPSVNTSTNKVTAGYV